MLLTLEKTGGESKEKDLRKKRSDLEVKRDDLLLELERFQNEYNQDHTNSLAYHNTWEITKALDIIQTKIDDINQELDA